MSSGAEGRKLISAVYSRSENPVVTPSYHPGVHRFAVFVVGWTVLLLVAGALVTSNDAALSVPDWPKRRQWLAESSTNILIA